MMAACAYMNSETLFFECFRECFLNHTYCSYDNLRYHIIFNVGTPSLEARNIRLVNMITYIIEESKLISENMSPNVIHWTSAMFL
jgi:hypothetical protein